MNALAIESSTDYLSLALQVDEQIFSYHFSTGSQASQLILPEIQRLLTEAKVKLKDLDVLVYGTGPGAFTGVRVAVGVTQGLAFGADIPVIGVSSVQTVAETTHQEDIASKVLVCLDARMGEVYHAAFVREDVHWQPWLHPVVCKPQDVPVVDGVDWVGAGSGWGIFEPVLSERYHGQLAAVRRDVVPKARAMLSIAQPLFESGQVQSAQEAAPLYVRNRVALTAAERAQGQTL